MILFKGFVFPKLLSNAIRGADVRHEILGRHEAEQPVERQIGQGECHGRDDGRRDQEPAPGPALEERPAGADDQRDQELRQQGFDEPAGPEDIRRGWLDGVRRVGLTAGASAPNILVQQVIARLRELGATSVRRMPGVEERVHFPLPLGLGIKNLPLIRADNRPVPLTSALARLARRER